jgi:hypothetical protein
MKVENKTLPSGNSRKKRNKRAFVLRCFKFTHTADLIPSCKSLGQIDRGLFS